MATVLVVEDDVHRSAPAKALRRAGLRFVEAAGAEEAVKVLAGRRHVDLVLTDMNLAGPSDGVALVQFAKLRRPRVKVVFLSADAANVDLRDLGDGFLFKPCDEGALVQTVANVLAAA